MWWKELQVLSSQSPSHYGVGLKINGQVDIHPTAIFDTSKGGVEISSGTRVCAGAYIQGPVFIGEHCLIGNNSMIRGAARIGEGVLIGFSAEVKQAILEAGVSIGPMCFVADSIVRKGAFLGALVRTSNFRLDNSSVQVVHEGQSIDTGMNKLGCEIGARTSLGVACRIYPGRVVPPDSLFEMDVHIRKNLPAGRYRIRQELELVD